MNHSLKIYIGLLVVLIFGIMLMDASRPKPIDWSPYYKTHIKKPLGLYVLNQELDQVFKNQKIERILETPYEYLDYYYIYDSIDGSYERAEYWRSGTVWEDIVNNARRIKQDVPHVKLGISYTLSWPNSLNLLDLHREWVELGIIDATDLDINILGGPHYFALCSLPMWKKQQIEKAYRVHMEWIKSFTPKTDHPTLLGKFEHVIDFMYNSIVRNNVKMNLYHFNIQTAKLDAIRNEDFFTVFPEHQDLREWMIENGAIQ
jgi:hypothetical protein